MPSVCPGLHPEAGGAVASSRPQGGDLLPINHSPEGHGHPELLPNLEAWAQRHRLHPPLWPPSSPPWSSRPPPGGRAAPRGPPRPPHRGAGARPRAQADHLAPL